MQHKPLPRGAAGGPLPLTDFCVFPLTGAVVCIGRGFFSSNLHRSNRWHLNGNRRRLECNRRRLQGNRRRLEGNRRRVETKCYWAKTRLFNKKQYLSREKPPV